jgi:hypothetical protein
MGYFKLISPYRMGICNGKRQIIYDVPGTEHVTIPRHLMPDYDQPVPI